MSYYSYKKNNILPRFTGLYSCFIPLTRYFKFSFRIPLEFNHLFICSFIHSVIYNLFHILEYNTNIFIPEGYFSTAEIADDGEVVKETFFLSLRFCGLYLM
jgi:hypothetical protein